MERIKRLLESKAPTKWLFYGDSITHGALHTFGARDYTQHFSERVRHELARGDDIVLNTAISGSTTRDLLSGFSWRVEQSRPHVVFLMIGTNDSSVERNVEQGEFERNLHDLCRRIDEIGGVPVLQTACPILKGTAPDREAGFPVYMEIIRRVACESRVPLIDHETYWRANEKQRFFWMSDPLHPNSFGHIVFSKFLFESLGILDPVSPVCRLFVP